VEGDVLHTDRTDEELRLCVFRRAYDDDRLLSLPPGQLGRKVKGGSYVHAILHAKRISRGEWD
jgi:hypothetical protein